MSYLELKPHETDDPDEFFMFCDYPGCVQEYRGDRMDLIEEGWKLAKIEYRMMTSKVAVCPDHADKGLLLVNKELKELKGNALPHDTVTCADCGQVFFELKEILEHDCGGDNDD